MAHLPTKRAKSHGRVAIFTRYARFLTTTASCVAYIAWLTLGWFFVNDFFASCAVLCCAVLCCALLLSTSVLCTQAGFLYWHSAYQYTSEKLTLLFFLPILLLCPDKLRVPPQISKPVIFPYLLDCLNALHSLIQSLLYLSIFFFYACTALYARSTPFSKHPISAHPTLSDKTHRNTHTK